jgi:large subunit ribosomal protein L31
MRVNANIPYSETTVICHCGNTFQTRSTVGGTLKTEVCANCHPFYTGRQKTIDSLKNIERFKRRYAKV